MTRALMAMRELIRYSTGCRLAIATFGSSGKIVGDSGLIFGIGWVDGERIASAPCAVVGSPEPPERSGCGIGFGGKEGRDRLGVSARLQGALPAMRRVVPDGRPWAGAHLSAFGHDAVSDLDPGASAAQPMSCSARRFFAGWFAWASRSQLKATAKVARMIRRHLDNIPTYLPTPSPTPSPKGSTAKCSPSGPTRAAFAP